MMRRHTTWRRISASACGLLMLAGLAGPAAAAEPTKGPRVIELEGIIIEGKIPKPQVFYVLGRSQVRYQSLQLDRSFVSRIVETAKQNPF
ncbi:MAG: hypothetical protein H6744_02575 [Deltaproteobacteria bacterium]|nr:hypothetical protein [Deltaproteobacteria bacterium]MCB9785557.1 hypothetical protein [Deltaproteobacteria bacterium]